MKAALSPLANNKGKESFWHWAVQKYCNTKVMEPILDHFGMNSCLLWIQKSKILQKIVTLKKKYLTILYCPIIIQKSSIGTQK